MYQPETEDMLPRVAPRPAAPTSLEHTAAMAKPTVPEVSLLFGQQMPTPNAAQLDTNAQNQTKPTTYNTWKKQKLPRVTFPATLATELGPSTSSSINSASTTTSQPSTVSSSNSGAIVAECTPPYRMESSATPPNNNASPQAAYAAYTNGSVGNNSGGYINTLEQYRRSYVHRFGAVGQVVTSYAAHTPKPRRSLDDAQIAAVVHRPAPEVLTICASTQTESVNVSPTNNASASKPTGWDISDLATKQDLLLIQCMLQELRDEQLRFQQYCAEMLLNEVHTKSAQSHTTCVKDAATQCELLASNNAYNQKRTTPNSQNYRTEQAHAPTAMTSAQEQPTPTQPLQAYNTFKTSAPYPSPAAQSTAYRANTPQVKRLPLAAANIVNVLPKPNTEKSLVMHELALKYLPQEKLTELLQDVHVSPGTGYNNENRQPMQQQQQYQKQPTTPLRPVDNYQKSPNDISNASYKYLKKYRLLPEERLHDYQQHQQPISPLCGARKLPMSPYHNQEPQQGANSPLRHAVRDSPAMHPAQVMLDLENIRNQPKFI